MVNRKPNTHKTPFRSKSGPQLNYASLERDLHTSTQENRVVASGVVGIIDKLKAEYAPWVDQTRRLAIGRYLSHPDLFSVDTIRKVTKAAPNKLTIRESPAREHVVYIGGELLYPGGYENTPNARKILSIINGQPASAEKETLGSRRDVNLTGVHIIPEKLDVDQAKKIIHGTVWLSIEAKQMNDENRWVRQLARLPLGTSSIGRLQIATIQGPAAILRSPDFLTTAEAALSATLPGIVSASEFGLIEPITPQWQQQATTTRPMPIPQQGERSEVDFEKEFWSNW